jgi:hypothetical protein
VPAWKVQSLDFKPQYHPKNSSPLGQITQIKEGSLIKILQKAPRFETRVQDSKLAIVQKS